MKTLSKAADSRGIGNVEGTTQTNLRGRESISRYLGPHQDRDLLWLETACLLCKRFSQRPFDLVPHQTEISTPYIILPQLVALPPRPISGCCLPFVAVVGLPCPEVTSPTLLVGRKPNAASGD